jgi:hypothetical protein
MLDRNNTYSLNFYSIIQDVQSTPIIIYQGPQNGTKLVELGNDHFTLYIGEGPGLCALLNKKLLPNF